MPPDLLRARSLGYILLRDTVPEGARLDPPFLRYDVSWSHEARAAAIEALLATAPRSKSPPG